MSAAQAARPPRLREGLLVMADGSVFEGEVLEGQGAVGEVVFNTVMAGYQEVLTDPSYAGQVIVFTYPHIGNYGVAPEDDESRRPFCRGVVARELTRQPSSWRATEDLAGWLVRHHVPAITGVDTRRLTRLIREDGAMPGAFGPVDAEEGSFDEAGLLAAARSEPPTDGRDLVQEVTCDEPYEYAPAQPTPGQPTSGQPTPGQPTPGQPLVVVYDFGVKHHSLWELASFARVRVVPASTPPEEVLAMGPDGVFLSNGPGDPAGVVGASATVKRLLGEVPIFGVCLGHQILARAIGGSTYKLRFGHHGGNHPVRRISTGKVEITSQNHNYAVAPGTFAERAEVTHVNLNDGVVEGLRCLDVPAFSVQYHPEAGPGPHDARYLFQEFFDLMCHFHEGPVVNA